MARIRLGVIDGGKFRTSARPSGPSAEEEVALDSARQKQTTEGLRQATLIAGLVKTGADLFGPAIAGGISRIGDSMNGTVEEQRAAAVRLAGAKAMQEKEDAGMNRILGELDKLPAYMQKAPTLGEDYDAEAGVEPRPTIPVQSPAGSLDPYPRRPMVETITPRPVYQPPEQLQGREPVGPEGQPRYVRAGEVTGAVVPGSADQYAAMTPDEASAEYQRMQSAYSLLGEKVNNIADLARKSENLDLKAQAAARIREMQAEQNQMVIEMGRLPVGEKPASVIPPGPPAQSAPPQPPAPTVGLPAPVTAAATVEEPVYSDSRLATAKTSELQDILRSLGADERAGRPDPIATAAVRSEIQRRTTATSDGVGSYGDYKRGDAIPRPEDLEQRLDEEPVAGAGDKKLPSFREMLADPNIDISGDLRKEVEKAGVTAESAEAKRVATGILSYAEAAVLAATQPDRIGEALAGLRASGYSGVRARSLTELIGGSHKADAEIAIAKLAAGKVLSPERKAQLAASTAAATALANARDKEDLRKDKEAPDRYTTGFNKMQKSGYDANKAKSDADTSFEEALNAAKKQEALANKAVEDAKESESKATTAAEKALRAKELVQAELDKSDALRASAAASAALARQRAKSDRELLPGRKRKLGAEATQAERDADKEADKLKDDKTLAAEASQIAIDIRAQRAGLTSLIQASAAKGVSRRKSAEMLPAIQEARDNLQAASNRLSDIRGAQKERRDKLEPSVEPVGPVKPVPGKPPVTPTVPPSAGGMFKPRPKTKPKGKKTP